MENFETKLGTCNVLGIACVRYKYFTNPRHGATTARRQIWRSSLKWRFSSQAARQLIFAANLPLYVGFLPCKKVDAVLPLTRENRVFVIFWAKMGSKIAVFGTWSALELEFLVETWQIGVS